MSGPSCTAPIGTPPRLDARDGACQHRSRNTTDGGIGMDVSLGLQSLNSALNILKTLSQIRDDTERALALAEVTRQLTSTLSDLAQAQQAQLALLQDKATLEADVVRLKDWSDDKSRYELREHGRNRALAYAVKTESQGVEPAHSLCPDCFADTKKSVLQPVKRAPGLANVLLCQRCGWEAYLDSHWRAEHGSASGSRRK